MVEIAAAPALTIRALTHFGAPQANDDERLALGHAEVRAMRPKDLREIVRIDRGITGRDRGSYIAARMAEAMDDSAIRVSLCARLEGAIAGFVMARADLGDFGRTEPVAVVDTIGVDIAHWKSGIGRSLVEQLFANLGELHIERVETVVASTDPRAAGALPPHRIQAVARPFIPAPPRPVGLIPARFRQIFSCRQRAMPGRHRQR